MPHESQDYTDAVFRALLERYARMMGLLATCDD